jgi:AcrR family transcriptional regulator
VASGRRAATVEQLIACAIELIAERGYAAMSVDALCERAGVAKTGLYWNFRNKEGLLRAVVDRVSAEWIAALKETAYASGDAIERLDRTLHAIKRRMIERPAELRVLLFALLERSSVDPEAHRALQQALKNARSALALVSRMLPVRVSTTSKRSPSSCSRCCRASSSLTWWTAASRSSNTRSPVFARPSSS